MAEHLLHVMGQGGSVSQSGAAATGSGKRAAGEDTEKSVHLFLVEELSIPSHKLKPIPLRGIMARRNDRPSLGAEKADHEKNGGGGGDSDVDDGAAEFPKTLNHPVPKTGAARSRVLGDDHLSPFRKKGKGPGEIADRFVGQRFSDDTPNS